MRSIFHAHTRDLDTPARFPAGCLVVDVPLRQTARQEHGGRVPHVPGEVRVDLFT